MKIRFPNRVRVMLMGVRQSYHNTRLAPGLAFLVMEGARKAFVRRKIQQLEMSWVLEDNDGMNAIAKGIGGVPYKRYRLYEKSL